jgi:hypothetical protein
MSRDGSAIAAWCQDGNIVYARHADGAWNSSATLAFSKGGASQPIVRSGNDDIVFAVWLDPAGVMAARYVGGWSAPEPLSVSSDLIFDLALSAGPDGTALVIWCQGSISTQDLYQSRFDGSSWTAPFPIETQATSAIQPSIASGNAGGRTFAMWNQPSNGHGSIWGQVHQMPAGWQGPHRVEVSDLGKADGGAVYFDETRNAFIAFWRQVTTGHNSLYWARYE